MGFFGKLKKKLKSPLFARSSKKKNKNKKRTSGEAINLASTCDVTEVDTFDTKTTSSTVFPPKDENRFNRVAAPLSLPGRYSALPEEEDNEEPPSPTDANAHNKHFFDSTSQDSNTISVIIDDTLVEKEDLCKKPSNEEEETTTVATSKYISSSEDEDDLPTTRESIENANKKSDKNFFAPRVVEPKTSSISNLYTRNTLEGNDDDDATDDDISHVFNDDLSTLYEVPTDREDNDSVISITSTSDMEDVMGAFRPHSKKKGGLLDNTNTGEEPSSTSLVLKTTERWDVALANMVCGESSMFGSKVALMDNEELTGHDMAEI